MRGTNSALSPLSWGLLLDVGLVVLCLSVVVAFVRAVRRSTSSSSSSVDVGANKAGLFSRGNFTSVATFGAVALSLLLLRAWLGAPSPLDGASASPASSAAPPAREPAERVAVRPAAYVPLYMANDYSLNATCAQADGSPGTCSPSFCSAVAAAGSSATACRAPTSAAVDPQAYLTSTATCSSTCTASVDSRCTTAALTAMFGGISSVYAAYCNDKYLVYITSSDTTFGNTLDNVVYPPGGTSPSGCRTRAASVGAMKMQTNRVYLSPTLLSTAAATNNINVASIFTGAAGSDTSYMLSPTNVVYGLPTRGPVGTTIAGQEVYPVFNNRGLLTPENCEVDGCNQHVGGGGGPPHLHGDPFGPGCLYTAANYSSLTAHPPLIAFNLDGYSTYGRHLSTLAPGYSDALDVCGGHSHGAYGYHYHTQVLRAQTSGYGSNGNNNAGTDYPLMTPGVYQCFRGDLSADPNLNVASRTVSIPCCSSTNKYVKAGFTYSPSAGGGSSSGSTAATASVSSNTAAIVGGVVGGLVGLAIIITLVWWFACKTVAPNVPPAVAKPVVSGGLPFGSAVTSAESSKPSTSA